MTIQTSVNRASPTHPRQFPPQRRPRPMRPHRRISRRQFMLLRKRTQRLLLKVHLAKDLRIRRLQRRQNMRDTSADKLPRGSIRSSQLPIAKPQFRGPSIHRLALGRTPPIKVDHRIPQHAVEPRDGRIVRAQAPRPLQRAHIRSLQNIFRKRRVRDTPLHKREEPRAPVEQCLQCRVRHKSRGERERRTAPTALAARAARTIRAIALRTAGAKAFRRHRSSPFRPPFRRSPT